MMVPQVISALIWAPSPITSMSFVTMVPVNLPSMRTVPSKVSFPSNSEPRPRRAFRSLPTAASRGLFALQHGHGREGLHREAVRQQRRRTSAEHLRWP